MITGADVLFFAAGFLAGIVTVILFAPRRVFVLRPKRPPLIPFRSIDTFHDEHHLPRP